MEGEVGATSVLTWARSWFTPSILFLLLNLIIGTIVVTSKGIARAHRHHQQQYNHPEEEEEHRAPYISRSTSSLLTRLRSIGSLSRYTSGDIPSESTPPKPLTETHPDPSEYEGRAHRHHEQQYNHPEEVEHRAPYVSRSTSSLLGRLRSIGSLSRYTSGDIPSISTPSPPPETHPDPSEHEGGSVRDHQLWRSQSSEARPKAEAEETAAAAGGRMHKSASARSVADVADRRAGTADMAVEEVDARADDFINRFRDQLRLQRLDSILRYKDMLNRGK